MIEILLLPIFLVWFGLAFPIAILIVGTIVWCTMHVLKDVAVPQEGDVWCPIHERRMHVKGTPRRFLVGVPFSALRRCELYGPYAIRCAKDCLFAAPSMRRHAVRFSP
jgi:hypothetical protein